MRKFDVVGFIFWWLMAGVALLFLDIAFARQEFVAKGVVIEKAYAPDRTGTGVGVGAGGSGAGTAVVTTHTAEEFKVGVRVKGTARMLDASEQVYLLAQEGDTVNVYRYRSVITGIVYQHKVE